MTELTFTAPSYAFLQSTMPCWKCSQATSVITVWVPSFIDTRDIEKPEDESEAGGTSTLRYIHALDDQVAAHVPGSQLLGRAVGLDGLDRRAPARLTNM